MALVLAGSRLHRSIARVWTLEDFRQLKTRVATPDIQSLELNTCRWERDPWCFRAVELADQSPWPSVKTLLPAARALDRFVLSPELPHMNDLVCIMLEDNAYAEYSPG
jgi:hypothetical protein